jgi:hypothetical protein
MDLTRRDALILGAGALVFPTMALAGRRSGWSKCSDGSWVNDPSLCIEPTTTSGSTTSSSDSYSSTLVDGYTPQYPSWLGHTWKADMGSTWNSGMDHCWRVAGSKSRFELRNTTNDRGSGDPSSKRRSELHENKTRMPNGVAMWGAHSFVDHAWSDPSGMLANGSGGAHMQMHMPSGGSPAFAFRRYKDGRFLITTNGDADSTSNHKRYIAALSFDQPHDLVYRFILDALKGELDVWLDGRHVVSLRGASIGSYTAGCYLCLGLYYGGGVTCPIVAEYGNFAFPATSSLLSRTTAPPRW